MPYTARWRGGPDSVGLAPFSCTNLPILPKTGGGNAAAEASFLGPERRSAILSVIPCLSGQARRSAPFSAPIAGMGAANTAPRAFAPRRSPALIRWAYVVSRVAMLCPSWPATSAGETFCESMIDAAVWRVLCGVSRGTPAVRQSLVIAAW
jgi:hypothetical protein